MAAPVVEVDYVTGVKPFVADHTKDYKYLLEPVERRLAKRLQAEMNAVAVSSTNRPALSCREQRQLLQAFKDANARKCFLPRHAHADRIQATKVLPCSPRPAIGNCGIAGR